MFLVKKTSQVRRDFTGIFRCEHCGSEKEKTQCYDDAYYHNEVIPKMKCDDCGKQSPSSGPSSTPDVPAHVQL